MDDNYINPFLANNRTPENQITSNPEILKPGENVVNNRESLAINPISNSFSSTQSYPSDQNAPPINYNPSNLNIQSNTTPNIEPHNAQDPTNAETHGNNIGTNKKSILICLRTIYSIFSLLLIGFLIADYFVLSSLKLFGNILFMIDEILIIIVILFLLLSFMLSFTENCKMNYIVRSVIIIIAWFFGFGVRSIGNINAPVYDFEGKLMKLTIARTLILFFSIPFSCIDNNGVIHGNYNMQLG